MDGTTNNNIMYWSGTTGTSGALTLSTNYSDCTTDSFWFPVPADEDWMPYHFTQYEPKWHITQGYKNQIESMWD